MLQLTFTTENGKTTLQASDLVDASRVYSRARDMSGEGASTFGDARVTAAGTFVARVSYNGKVWASAAYRADDTLLYDPFAVVGDPATPDGVQQVRSEPQYLYTAPQAVRTFDTFALSTTDGGGGVLRVYAGTGAAADPDGAAFDFLNGDLIRWGARVTPETMAAIRACLAGAA